MRQPDSFTLHSLTLDSHQQLNQHLIEGLFKLLDSETTRKSHHFLGRYENIYISNEQLPALKTLLDAAIEAAALILQRPSSTLKAGCWFNMMNPGDKTTLHRHDDDDELLSAVYYAQVYDNSGLLQLVKKGVQTQVTPKEGLLVLFAPDTPHEVTENKSNGCRISLGINIGPK